MRPSTLGMKVSFDLSLESPRMGNAIWIMEDNGKSRVSWRADIRIPENAEMFGCFFPGIPGVWLELLAGLKKISSTG